MPISLAQAKLNATDDIEVQTIDEFQKSSDVLSRMPFHDVVSGTGLGATLTYGYQRVTTQPTAAFRAINSEYVAQEAQKTRYTVECKPLGGSFQIDRVLDRVAQSAETAFQLSQKIKATGAKFHDEFINGDTAVDANGFDGLSKAITGSSTEYLPLSNGVTSGYIDLSTSTAYDTEAEWHAVLDHIDAFLGALDGNPDALYMNRQLKTKLKSIARRAGFWERTRDEFGRTVDTYNGIPMIDLGEKPGSTSPIIDNVSRDADAGGAGGSITNLTDLYAVRFGLDGVHGASMAGAPLVQTWLPDFSTAGAVKTGEVEMGPVASVLKATKAAGVLRNFKIA